MDTVTVTSIRASEKRPRARAPPCASLSQRPARLSRERPHQQQHEQQRLQHQQQEHQQQAQPPQLQPRRDGAAPVSALDAALPRPLPASRRADPWRDAAAAATPCAVAGPLRASRASGRALTRAGGAAAARAGPRGHAAGRPLPGPGGAAARRAGAVPAGAGPAPRARQRGQAHGRGGDDAVAVEAAALRRPHDLRPARH